MCASHTASEQSASAAPVQSAPTSASYSAPPQRSALACALVWLGVAVIKAYQITLSPFLGQHCRFIPTCSHYGVEALRVHGPIKGSWLTLRRLSRCHPLGGKSGWDPVPLADHLAHATPRHDPSAANH